MKQSAIEAQVFLKDSFPEAAAASGGETWCYAKELRTLGQALEGHKLDSVDLEVESGVYFVRGKAKVAKTARSSFARLIHGIFRADSNAKNGGEVELRYTSNEIRQLGDEARMKRQDGSKTPDPYSLSQMLRGAGSYLDNKQTSLVGITIRGRWITLRYKTAEGGLEQTKQDLEYFFDYWVKMYLRRSNRAKPLPDSDPTLVVTWEGMKKHNPTY